LAADYTSYLNISYWILAKEVTFATQQVYEEKSKVCLTHTTFVPITQRMSEQWLKGSPSSITERRDPELIPVVGSQPAGDVSHKPGSRLHYFPPGLQAATSFALGEQRHDGYEQFASDCYPIASQLRFEPSSSAPESSMLTTLLASHPTWREVVEKDCQAHKLNKQDAMGRSRWRKLIKHV